MSPLTLALAAFLAAAVVAQPFVDVPQMPLFNFAGTGDAVTSAIIVNGWAFTANSTGIVGLNSSDHTPPSGATAFYSPLAGVSQFVPMKNWGFIAIAGSTIAHYRVMTNGTRMTANYTIRNATFDLQYSSTAGPSRAYPLFVNTSNGFLMILGTQNTSTLAKGETHLQSTIFAFHPVTLQPVWATVVNADTTNYVAANDTQFVWCLARNTSYGYSTSKVYKLFINNGTQANWFFDTGYSSTPAIATFGNQFMISLRSGYIYIGDVNGTTFGDVNSVSGCGDAFYTPFVLNTTWYVVCGSRIYEYSTVTGAQLNSNNVFQTMSQSSVDCGAYHPENQQVAFVASSEVYVINSSGIVHMLTFNDSIYSYNGRCTGASFDFRPTHNSTVPVIVNDVIHFSFTAYYQGDAGNVITMDYATGEIFLQASGNVDPYGAVVVDFDSQKMIVASRGAGPLLQGYDFVRFHNSSSFVTVLDHSSYNTFRLAHNASNGASYFVSSSGYITAFDASGAVVNTASFSSFSSSVPIIIVGQYVVIGDRSSGYIYAYDSVAKTVSSASTCYLSDYFPPIAYGNFTVLLICSSTYSNDQPAQMVNLKTMVVSKPFTFQSTATLPPDVGGFVVGTKFIFASDSNILSAYDMSVATPKMLWHATVSSTQSFTFSYFISNPVVIGSVGYFSGNGLVVTTTTTTYTSVIVSFNLATGVMINLGIAVNNTDSSYKTLIAKQDGVFGSGVLYLIGNKNITAYTVDGQIVFTYTSPNTIVTRNTLNPSVMSSGAVCFYDNNNFNVVSGFNGVLAWSYPVSTSSKYAFFEDSSSIYFSSGPAVVAAATYTGAVNGITAFESSNIVGFAVAPGAANTTNVFALTSKVIFSASVNVYASPVSIFPGQASPFGPGGNTGASTGGKSKAWIAAVVVGIIIAVVGVAVFLKKRKEAVTFDEDYVPMNPSTQV